jgi:hypothetical protein
MKTNFILFSLVVLGLALSGVTATKAKDCPAPEYVPEGYSE